MEAPVIYLKGLQNEEHLQYHADFGSMIKKFGAEKIKCDKQLEVWEEKFRQEDIALKKVTKSTYTERIHTVDKYRSQMVRGLTGINKYSLLHYDPKVQASAKKLQILFDTYGKISRKSMNNKTAAITNLLADLAKGRMEDVKTVGIRGWLDELHTANEEFEQLTGERDEEVAGRTKIVLEEARTQTDAAYRAIVKRVDAFITVEEENEVYNNFFSRLAALNARYNAVVMQRKGRGKGPEETTTPPAEDEETNTEE
jgi:hypothetical protein